MCSRPIGVVAMLVIRVGVMELYCGWWWSGRVLAVGGGDWVWGVVV